MTEVQRIGRLARKGSAHHVTNVHSVLRVCSGEVSGDLNVLLFGIGTRGPCIMGFENEVEQSFGRPCCQMITWPWIEWNSITLAIRRMGKDKSRLAVPDTANWMLNGAA